MPLKFLYQKLKERVQHYDFFETLRHTSVYFTANILINALGIIAIPIYTSFLDTSEYGIVEVFNNAVKVLAVLLTFNTHQAVGRYYYEEKEDWPSFLGATYISTFLVFLSFGGVVLLFQDQLLHYLNIPKSLFYLLFPAILALVSFTIFNHFFVARKESLMVAKNQVFLSYGRFAGAVICLLLITPGYYAKVIGDVTVCVLLGTYVFYKIYPFIKWELVKGHLKYILKFSLPLVPFSLSGFILNFFDLFMINSSSNADAGLYAFAYKIGLLLLGLSQALQNAANPDFYKWMNTSNYSDIENQVKSMMKFLAIGASFLILFAFDLGHLLASKDSFKAALSLVPVIVLGIFLNSIYSFYSRLLFYAKRTFYISFATIAAGVLNIVLNSIYIPKFGYEAAAYTTLVSYFFLAVLGAFIAIVIFKYPPPPLKDIFIKLFYVLMVTWLGHLVMTAGFGYSVVLVLKVLIFVALFLILFGGKLFKLITNKQ